jgi:hypothetical protein
MLVASPHHVFRRLHRRGLCSCVCKERLYNDPAGLFSLLLPCQPRLASPVGHNISPAGQKPFLGTERRAQTASWTMETCVSELAWPGFAGRLWERSQSSEFTAPWLDRAVGPRRRNRSHDGCTSIAIVGAHRSDRLAKTGNAKRSAGIGDATIRAK